MARDLFLMVMEADGDLAEPFDMNGTDNDNAETSPEQTPPEPDGMDD